MVKKFIKNHWYQWLKFDKIIDDNGWIVKIHKKTIDYNGFFSKTIDHSIILKKWPSLWSSPHHHVLENSSSPTPRLLQPGLTRLSSFKVSQLWRDSSAIHQQASSSTQHLVESKILSKSDRDIDGGGNQKKASCLQKKVWKCNILKRTENYWLKCKMGGVPKVGGGVQVYVALFWMNPWF